MCNFRRKKSKSERIKNTPLLNHCFSRFYSHSDLTLHKGEIITLLKQVDENWYEGLCNGCQGFLPANYVEVSELHVEVI